MLVVGGCFDQNIMLKLKRKVMKPTKGMFPAKIKATFLDSVVSILAESH
jgi:hypothetical protein